MDIENECRHCEFGVGLDEWYCCANIKVFKNGKGKVKCSEITQCSLEGVNMGELYKWLGIVFIESRRTNRGR